MLGYQLDDEPNLYMGNRCFTKHPFRTGCLEFQVHILFFDNHILPLKKGNL